MLFCLHTGFVPLPPHPIALSHTASQYMPTVRFFHAAMCGARMNLRAENICGPLCDPSSSSMGRRDSVRLSHLLGSHLIR